LADAVPTACCPQAVADALKPEMMDGCEAGRSTASGQVAAGLRGPIGMRMEESSTQPPGIARRFKLGQVNKRQKNDGSQATQDMTCVMGAESAAVFAGRRSLAPRGLHRNAPPLDLRSPGSRSWNTGETEGQDDVLESSRVLQPERTPHAAGIAVPTATAKDSRSSVLWSNRVDCCRARPIVVGIVHPLHHVPMHVPQPAQSRNALSPDVQS
jgi:hypothetical protein